MRTLGTFGVAKPLFWPCWCGLKVHFEAFLSVSEGRLTSRVPLFPEVRTSLERFVRLGADFRKKYNARSKMCLQGLTRPFGRICLCGFGRICNPTARRIRCPFGRICNPAGVNIGICNAITLLLPLCLLRDCKSLYSMLSDFKSDRTEHPLPPFFLSAPRSDGFQIRLNGVPSCFFLFGGKIGWGSKKMSPLPIEGEGDMKCRWGQFTIPCSKD